MEPMKPIIKRPSIGGETSGPDTSSKGPTKKRKSVSFAPSPEKHSKQRASAKRVSTPRSKTLIQKNGTAIGSPGSRHSLYRHQWPRPLRYRAKSSLRARFEEIIRPPSQSSIQAKSDEIIKRQTRLDLQARLDRVIKQQTEPNPEDKSGGVLKPPPQPNTKGEPDEVFEPPSELIEPFDPKKDWFMSMHTCVSCIATPVHVVGIKKDKGKRQCEGIEGLDERLMSGQVSIIFHPDRHYEPPCETCWTIKEGYGPDLDLPGSWPKEFAEIETEAKPHTHIYHIVYTGCKNGSPPGSPESHSLKLVKGRERYGGNGTMCRCNAAIEKATGGEEEESKRLVRSEIVMPTFAGCPACEGKKLKTCVRTNHTSNNK
ncbi:hypothetical protein TWF481_010494 [Arthrobotrys musiformis]|uniref:Uncharacterized protein n=1 Tax=Arthrobotrys musiformis TaxID=47236 RepID=A0AAV9W3R1_9PEZI